jgi:23S rRNA pseudouridine955/2504/2580 synthase/23S rRNA pseudouridine1911/1915/1917 synthase
MNEEIGILYQDESVLIINKPTAYLSMPDRFELESPVVLRELEAGYGRLWPIAPPDLDSSGMLLAARTEAANKALATSFEAGEVRRAYRAVVRGRPSWKQTSCDLPLVVDGDRKHRTIIDGTGKAALTEVTVLGVYGGLALVEAVPVTGRTHQVRVHLAALGYPVICDPLYGDNQPLFLSKIKRRWKGDPRSERPLMLRAAIHSWSVDFPHPQDAEVRHFEAPYPRDMRALVNQLEKL